MSMMGPIGGILGSAAGSPLAQTKGATTERAKQESTTSERLKDSDIKTEKAAGIGETEGDSQTSDRDADGRRLWEQQISQEAKDSESDDETNTQPTTKPKQDDDDEHIDLVG